MSTPLFSLGQVVATQGALDLMQLTETRPLRLVELHSSGNWGEIDPQDIAANLKAVLFGGRIMSVYRLPLADTDDDEFPPRSSAIGPETDDRIWIITEADRSVTTLLLPGEY